MERLGPSMKDGERLSRNFEIFTLSLVGSDDAACGAAPLFGCKCAPPRSAVF